MREPFPMIKDGYGVHIASPPGLDQVTLCGQTDYLLEKVKGKPVDHGPVTCWACRQIAAFCHEHKPLRRRNAK